MILEIAGLIIALFCFAWFRHAIKNCAKAADCYTKQLAEQQETELEKFRKKYNITPKNEA